LAPDPIAMEIDDYGRIYLTRTNRQKNSEFDIRGHQDWMTPSISLQTVEDRRQFLRETFAPEKSAENSWFPDLNGDGLHDWKDLTVEQDEVWMLEDSNANGVADKSTRILSDFNEEITDVAGALMVQDNEIFVGIGPDMWRIKDTNGDLVMDEKTSIAHGFAVHIGFGAHGMSGATMGPDGKVYWSIGDIGASITTVEGEKHHLPNQGMIVRSNLDGTDFEVFARGLRNTHEFVFDTYGNIISSDNDGDHAGESERLVHIVEGSDAGWRANWQYGKYTDPKNNGYNVWMDEKLYKPRWEGQAAYIIPPLVNFHNGPTGMAYNPGTALGKEWLNTFFLVEFVGDPSLSHIWAFDLEPQGASFALKSEKDVLSGVLPTGLRFGPDGALYLADWINGWGTKNYGRVWKLDVSQGYDNLEKERLETQRLMTMDYDDASSETLVALLSYPDMRIRQKAQFALAKSTFWGYRTLKEVIVASENQLARIHAVWGIGQIAAKNMDKANPLLDLLSDPDPEIVAQAAKVLGDVRYQKAIPALLPLLGHTNARVQFYAAQALGRLRAEAAIPPLLALLAKNQDKDLYLRHAGVLALSRIGQADPLVALIKSPDRSLRIAAVLVLRRLGDARISRFLNDSDEYIVTEAARAINDDWSIPEALPDLAKVLTKGTFSSEPLLRRSINASLRVGGEQELKNLLAFAKRPNVPAPLRQEALEVIGTWGNPSVLDRVDGRFRGANKKDTSTIQKEIEADIPLFLNDEEGEIVVGVIQILGNLGITTHNKKLETFLKTHPNISVRASAMKALGKLAHENLEGVLEIGMKDSSEKVRAVALGFLDKAAISKANLSQIVDPIFRKGSVAEQQKMLAVLAKMPLEKTRSVLGGLIKRATANRLSPEVTLDLIEAVEATKSNVLLAQLQSVKNSGHTVDSYAETLYGGDRGKGKNVFANDPTAQCVRCHALGGVGGKVGPPLDNIGAILSREELLEALIEPNKRLAPGYGSISVTLTDGQKVIGLLEKETHEELVLRTSNAEPLEIPISRIKERKNLPSAMPAMGKLITKRQLRDLMEFLANLKSKDKSS
ncbi:MAG: HEAT repeat domain-containing protein, partial [Bacteroidota bacterium]